MDFEGFGIGQFYPGDSVIHRLDPRIKVIISFLLAVTLFMIKNFWGFVGIFLFVFFIIFFSRLSARLVLSGLRPMTFILVFTFIIHLFFTSGTPLINFGFLVITKEGFVNSLFINSRLILLITGTSLLTFTTAPVDLTDGLESLLKPLEIFRLSSHQFALMMTVALRFIPVLIIETNKIMKAQKARGADFKKGNLAKRAKNYLSLLIPLLVSVFRRADELALAMESRCYRGGEGRTRMNELKIGYKDFYAFSFTVLVLFVVAIVGWKT
ncbi:MAG: energy-coupling factor transporter transmembrane protein EcfT [Actinobacteria bacterium]|nr:energy-coupling factor transporter transmembrane protein EcfT [Actinomycetota bacterium]